MYRWTTALAVMMVLLLGCPESKAPRPFLVDGDVSEDDRDADGLCDFAEEDFGTDPDQSDTDGDGYLDAMEVLFGYDPTLATSPDRSTVLVLRESSLSGTQATVAAVVDGRGEDYGGAFEAMDAFDLFDMTAESFYAGSVALFADPSANVGLIDYQAERFRGVVGETHIAFETRFSFGDNTPRICLRAFPFRYNLKRSDGQLLGSKQYLLLVLPLGDNLATGTWCNIPDPCIS